MLTILAWDTRRAGYVFVVLAWIFVICRVLQAYVHVTSNDVRWRERAHDHVAIYIVEVLTGGTV